MVRVAAAAWILALGVELLAGAAAIRLAGQHGPAIIGALLNLLVGLRFASTLLPGRVPLISHYARFDIAGLPAECEAYTRGLTLAWAGLLGGFALAHAAAPLGGWTTGSVLAWQGVILPGLFLAEHLLRSWRLPQLGRATPWRTLRAVWASFTPGGAGHGA